MPPATLANAAPLDLGNWLAENKDKLEPPVNNSCLYSGDDFVLMIVGGPNSRNDFHGTRAVFETTLYVS